MTKRTRVMNEINMIFHWNDDWEIFNSIDDGSVILSYSNTAVIILAQWSRKACRVCDAMCHVEFRCHSFRCASIVQPFCHSIITLWKWLVLCFVYQASSFDVPCQPYHYIIIKLTFHLHTSSIAIAFIPLQLSASKVKGNSQWTHAIIIIMKTEYTWEMLPLPMADDAQIWNGYVGWSFLRLLLDSFGRRWNAHSSTITFIPIHGTSGTHSIRSIFPSFILFAAPFDCHVIVIILVTSKNAYPSLI